jgi:hypothetical protein
MKMKYKYYENEEAKKNNGVLLEGELDTRLYSAGEHESALRKSQRQMRDRTGEMITWYDEPTSLRSIFEIGVTNTPLPPNKLWDLIVMRDVALILKTIQEENGLSEVDIKNFAQQHIAGELETLESTDGSTHILRAEQTTASHEQGG